MSRFDPYIIRKAAASRARAFASGSKRRAVPSKPSGTPANVYVGQVFKTRAEVRDAGLHAPLMDGIDGTPEFGATSVVISGGYNDDEDSGDVVWYTGMGGRDAVTGDQIQDQKEDHRMNTAMKTAMRNKSDVRVIRGHKGHSKYAPKTGYRYDGLYKVTDMHKEVGINDTEVIKFKLEQNKGQVSIGGDQQLWKELFGSDDED